jgi:oligosaccharyltransferase complex subunit beta
MEEKKKGKWESFLPSDVQFEAIMLDPYIRTNMTVVGKALEAKFKLPDQYGVFTFKVDYNRRGLSHVVASETVQVRPYRHDQYPRFLVIARPYYTNLFAFMFMFFVITTVFLLYKEPVSKKLKTD